MTLFVSGGARSGKTFALAAHLSEVVGSRFALSSAAVDGGDGPLKTGSVIWVSPQRFSAEAFRNDLACWFPKLVGVVRITTPRGLVHAGFAPEALVVCDDVDAWSGNDLSIVDSLLRSPLRAEGSEPVGSGLVGVQLGGVSADRQGPHGAEAVAVWPSLRRHRC